MGAAVRMKAATSPACQQQCSRTQYTQRLAWLVGVLGATALAAAGHDAALGLFLNALWVSSLHNPNLPDTCRKESHH